MLKCYVIPLHKFLEVFHYHIYNGLEWEATVMLHCTSPVTAIMVISALALPCLVLVKGENDTISMSRWEDFL